MKRLILAMLLCCAPAVAQAADAIVLSTDASQTLYVRIYPTSSTAVHNTLTAGTSNAVRRYAVTDAALVTAGLAASTSGVTVAYAYDVFYGTSSASADDVLWGSGTLFWKDGAAQGGPDTGVTLTQDNIDDISDAVIAAGQNVPVSQVPVPEARTWVLKPSVNGLVGESKRGVADGEAKLFAVDFRNDLPTNGRLTDVDAVEILTGTAGGVTFASTANDPGVDKTLAKVSMTAVTAGTYTIKFTVSYQSADGGGTSVGVVTLVVN